MLLHLLLLENTEKGGVKMKVVIVGGVAGGATAAARIRRLDEQAEIVVFERSGFVSYANCGLPYYVGGVITHPQELTLQSPEGFWDRFRIDVRVNHEVTDIDAQAKTVTVQNLKSGEVFVESYDKLLLSPGAKPTKPALSGVDSSRIFTLRTVEDTLKIRDYIMINKPKSAVLAGGGYIGLEMAENLVEMGVTVTMVQRPKQLLAPLDPDMASYIHGKLRSKGVSLMLGHTVEGFEENLQGISTLLKDASPLKADMVILAIGVAPDTPLAAKAGLTQGIKGSIAVNDKMETGIPDIYAVGDAVEVEHFVTKKPAVISLAGPANKQGRIAADNICGGNSRYDGSQGSSVIKVFDMTVGITGINEKTASSQEIDYDTIILTPNSHAPYYPGAQPMAIKVLFQPDTLKILGAQIIGFEGVDKRIDVISTAIRLNASALQLQQLDLAYAPPYSSAKDPVNMAGFMIENIHTGKVKQFYIDELENLPADGSITLLDTRTNEEFQFGHVEGAMNIPVDDLRDNLAKLPKDKPVYVVCQTGLRSYIACRILSQNGFDCYNLAGGFGHYQVARMDKMAAKKQHPCGMRDDH